MIKIILIALVLLIGLIAILIDKTNDRTRTKVLEMYDWSYK